MVIDGAIADKPELSDTEKKAETIAEIRKMRDNLLNISDWTQITDSPLTAEDRTEWQLYRQQLRDLPASNTNATNIADVTFPDSPA